VGAEPLRVYLESGRTRTFAAALDWPGFARRGKGEEGALEELLSYADRYALVGGPFGFSVGEPVVVGRLEGKLADFGALDAIGPWDDEPADAAELGRQADLLAACWRRFDDVVARAPAELAKGPRGGGRDRDQIVDHVREAERSYGRKLGARVPPRTPWPEQRVALLDAIRAGGVGGSPRAGTVWPVRYAVRRFAWHVLDHAWEIEDKG
jgi:hypothetical protein